MVTPVRLSLLMCAGFATLIEMTFVLAQVPTGQPRPANAQRQVDTRLDSSTAQPTPGESNSAQERLHALSVSREGNTTRSTGRLRSQHAFRPSTAPRRFSLANNTYFDGL